MSWISDLAETYDVIAVQKDGTQKKNVDLLPLAHSTQNAQIKIILKPQGEFWKAEIVPIDERVVIIPVTEDSATRSSGIAPHPLFDKLEYVAGDYGKFVKKCQRKKFDTYVKLLEQWQSSDYGSAVLDSIVAYVKKQTLVKDLLEAGLFTLEDGYLASDKINGIAFADCFIIFDVMTNTMANFSHKALWLDDEFRQLYTDFYLNEKSSESSNICYVTGKETFVTDKHPAKIRNTADKSKLISANDSSGFAFRGRFASSEQAASVSYESSQKAHSALRWLLKHQGFHIEDLYIVAFEKSQKEFPSPFLPSEDSLFVNWGGEEETVVTTNASYAKKVAMAAAGYKSDLDTNAEIVVMAVEAATTGRLSVVFYEKFYGSQFMENIEKWYTSFFWKYNYKKWNDETKKFNRSWVVGTPSPREIADAAFGATNGKIIKSAIERLLPCIISGKKIPVDIVKAVYNKANSRGSFQTTFEYQCHIALTCALIRKYRSDYFEEEWDMALDENCKDRSYLFGRLLGAAHYLEESALDEGDKGRQTAAERYAQHFPKQPVKTWGMITNALVPYKAKLKADKKTYKTAKMLEKLMREISDKIEVADFESQAPLTELYWLGYNHQLNDFYKKKDAQNTEQVDVNDLNQATEVNEVEE